MLRARSHLDLGTPDPFRRHRLQSVHHGFQKPEELFEETTSDAIKLVMEHLDLLPLLAAIRARIRRYFGAETLTRLDLSRAEEPGEPRQLVVLIRPAGSARSAFDTLHRFDEEWWFEADNSEDRIMVDVRPR